MRICVLGSCGKTKAVNHHKAPTCEDLDTHEKIKFWRKGLSERQLYAGMMYTGNQARELNKGIAKLRSISELKVDYFIISAGFGMLNEEDKIPPYDCSFTGMKKSEIEFRSEILNIPSDFEKIQAKGYELMYLALGKDYLTSLGNEWYSNPTQKIVCFQRKMKADHITNISGNSRIVRAYSKSGHKVHGVLGFKGDLLRILADHALKQESPFEEVRSWLSPQHFYDLFYSLGNLQRP